MLWVLMGWTPIVIAVGSEASWNASALGRVLKSNIEKAGGTVHFIPYDYRLYSGLYASHISQISRLMAGYLPNVPDDAYILLTDGDIWPLRPSYYKRIDFSKQVCIMNANDYRRGRTDYWNAYRYPLTNIGAYKKAWRTIVRVSEPEALNIAANFQKSITKYFKPETAAKILKDPTNPHADMFTAMLVHYLKQPIAKSVIKRRKMFELDELTFVQYVKSSPFWQDGIQFLTRNVGADRLSKYGRDKKWMVFKNLREYGFTASDVVVLDKLIDGHVGKGKNHQGQKGDWGVLRQLISVVIEKEDDVHWGFLDQYWREFQAASLRPDEYY